MATNANNVTVAGDGMIRIGPTTATAPTGTGGATTGFSDLGYLTEDSFSIKPTSKTDEIRMWQRGDNVRTIVSESGLTVEFAMGEINATTGELYFGSKPTTSGSEGSVSIKPGVSGGQKSMIVDVVDGANLTRFYFHHVEVTERKEIKGGTKAAMSLGVTLTAYPDTDGAVGTMFSTLLKSA